MDISPNVLRKETVDTLQHINNQIGMVSITAAKQQVPAVSLVDHNGNYVLTPLLLAKAQCLNTLVLLRDKES